MLSFGRVFADGATNVIPDKMTIEGTFRTLDETWRYKAHQLIENAVNSIAEGYGAKAIVKIIKGYPSVVNDSILTTSLKDFAIELLGEDNVVDLPIRMTGEDFGYISQLTPSCFYRLGVRNEDKGIVNGVHSPHFDIDEKAIQSHLPSIIDALKRSDCEIRADDKIFNLYDGLFPANEEDWYTEYLDAIISIKSVKNVEEAVSHINNYGSGHTESIVSQDKEAVDYFFSNLNSAIILNNASTQFADGGEFGMGAEIGIATDKIHARGPVGARQLTSYKYLIQGNGQTRPS